MRGTVNRLTGPPETVIGRARAADRAYAREELYAFWLSWLATLPGPVLNAPDPRGLGGAHRSPEEWALLAAAAGLPADGALPAAGGASRVGTGATVTMLAVAGAVTGPVVDPAVRAAVRRLADRAGTALLGVALARRGGGWCFAGATTHPDLRAGGERALDALAAALRARAGDGPRP